MTDDATWGRAQGPRSPRAKGGDRHHAARNAHQGRSMSQDRPPGSPHQQRDVERHGNSVLGSAANAIGGRKRKGSQQERSARGLFAGNRLDRYKDTFDAGEHGQKHVLRLAHAHAHAAHTCPVADTSSRPRLAASPPSLAARTWDWCRSRVTQKGHAFCSVTLARPLSRKLPNRAALSISSQGLGR